MAIRDILNRWVLRSRGMAWGLKDQYMSYISSVEEDEDTSGALLETLEDPRRRVPIIGDLVVVKCDLQFVKLVGGYMGYTSHWHHSLPKGINAKFINGHMGEKPFLDYLEYGISPRLDIRVYENPDDLLSLTSEDYDNSQNETKTWSTKSVGGYIMNDYVYKFANRGQLDGDVKDIVYFFSLAFGDDEIITSMPGVYEYRKKKEWYADGDVFYDGLDAETNIKLPVIGIVATLLDSKLVRHSVTKRQEYIGGEGCETMFYKILFRGRRPIWVDSIIWRCPEALSLPIYLPLP